MMMTDKHSPGPWHAHANSEGQPLRRIGCTVGPSPGGGYSSVCVALIPEASQNATADALLIAAAPELLEIVEQLIACHDEPTCPAVAVARELVGRIRAA